VSAPGGTRWVRRMWGYVSRHRRDLWLGGAAAVAGAVCQTIVPLVERQIVDGVIVEHSSPLWIWLVALVGLSALAFGFAYERRYRGGKLALGVQYDLRNEMHDHLQAMDLDNLNRMPTGQLVARANSDSTLVQGLLGFLPIMSGNVLLMVLSLVVMFWLSVPLALVAAVAAPAVILVSYRMRWRVFPATWDAQQREGDVAQIVDEDVNGVRIVKAFGQEQRELERLVGATKVLYGSQMRAVRIQSRYQPLLELIPSLAQVAVLAIGGYLALHGKITIGTFLAFSTYVAQLVAPARMLAGVLTVGQQARAGIERIFQLIDHPPAIGDVPGAVVLDDLDGSIDFDGVTFSYPDGHRVLDGFELHLAPGDRVAIVGASGSGKSTVALMVGRFFDPVSGSVRVDDCDVREVAIRSLRRQIGYVFEESFLFSESVRANIAYARPEATDDEIEAAARVAGAHGFVLDLPHGYDTVVGERGLTLSGGQRQRIALARAILARPRILILDDATSAVDAKVEAGIHEALRHEVAGRTTLLIAHRRSTLHLADRIAVMENGRVVEEGTHDELVAGSRLYRTLLSGYDEEESEAIEESIDALVMIGAGSTLLDADAWTLPAPGQSGGTPGGSRPSFGAPTIGPGLGRGGGGSWRRNLAPTPELLARVEALPAVRDFPEVDLARESRRVHHFTLRGLLSEFRRPLLLGLALVVTDGVFTLLGPVLVKDGIDRGVATGSQRALFVAAGLLLAVALADFVNQIAETFVTGRTAQRIMLSLRIRVWAQLQRLSLDYYEREMAGRIMTRMTTDVDQFESLIQNGLLTALVSVVTFVGVGVVLVVMNAELGLLTLTVTMPLAAATVVFRQRATRLYDLARERIAAVNADFQESLSGVRESQAFVHEGATIERFHALGRDYLETRVAAQRLVAVYFPFVSQLLAGCADAIILGVGAGLVVSGQMTSGELIAFILYIDLFFSPVQQLSQVFDSWQQTRVSMSRIGDLMAMETLTPAADHPVDPGRLHGDVKLDSVRFTYPAVAVRARARDTPAALELRGPADPKLVGFAGDRPVRPPEALRSVDLDVRFGETVALVGETGAGKSTVVKLVARFYDPDSGRVTIDGSHDLRSLDLLIYRRQLGYVPQEAFLFTGTVRDNIAYGKPDASDGEVEAAARTAGAHDLIAALPGGYHHELSERGRSLSAGQRQLIALARTELVKPAILLLDEATSNLDLATEARVAAAMRRVSAGRTTIVIAHRLQTARAADRIVVLHAGRAVETGSHEELLALGGRYAGMWRAFDMVEGVRARAEAEIFEAGELVD
jgi:ATP-binding cassette subfamily B protein